MRKIDPVFFAEINARESDVRGFDVCRVEIRVIFFLEGFAFIVQLGIWKGDVAQLVLVRDVMLSGTLHCISRFHLILKTKTHGQSKTHLWGQFYLVT